MLKKKKRIITFLKRGSIKSFQTSIFVVQNIAFKSKIVRQERFEEILKWGITWSWPIRFVNYFTILRGCHQFGGNWDPI